MYNNSNAEQFNLDHECFEDVCWRDLSVGKIIKIQKNDTIPADVLILKSSSPNGFSYLQTSSLDGETGLKPREAIYKMQNLINGEKDLGNLNFEDNLYYFSVNNTLLRVSKLNII